MSKKKSNGGVIETCKPRKEVLEGELDDAIAADVPAGGLEIEADQGSGEREVPHGHA